MPKPYPQEFRDDVVRVARDREPGVTLAQVAKDFGIHEMTLAKWMRRVAIDDGHKPGTTSTESAELRELRKRNRLLSRRTRSCDGLQHICRRRTFRENSTRS